MSQKALFRIGNGFDVHAFQEGMDFLLAGVKIPFNKTLKAHSDGDVLLHSLASALLGSLALGDLGSLYPDTDVKYYKIDSKILVRDAYDRVQKNAYCLSNLDISIICEEPKIRPYFLDIRKSLMELLNLELKDISVKAVTTEKLGFLGRVEGIAVLTSLMITLI